MGVIQWVIRHVPLLSAQLFNRGCMALLHLYSYLLAALQVVVLHGLQHILIHSLCNWATLMGKVYLAQWRLSLGALFGFGGSQLQAFNTQ